MHSRRAMMLYFSLLLFMITLVSEGKLILSSEEVVEENISIKAMSMDFLHLGARYLNNNTFSISMIVTIFFASSLSL